MKCLLLVLSVALSAQPTLHSPPLAHVLDGEGRLTAIYGLAGNFIHGRPGPALLAYANDGDIEWRLEPGRLSATRDGRTAVYATVATSATFHGEFAVLPESKETLRLVGESLVDSSDETPSQLAGRAARWQAGKLRIFQRDGSEDEIDCPQEPDAMSAASADWAFVSINRRPYLLRLTHGRVQLFVLPQRSRE
ncbi:MAG: hypothetical protein JNM66_23160 [Bryobacterales bacterium]|nr:hypothetical protein [Bryobacterales bacterium]